MKIMKRTVCTLLGGFCMLTLMQAQVRTEQLLEKGWKFTREDKTEFSSVGYDDAKWQNVTVPHDWAIYGPFSPHNDRQFVAIEQDGQKEAISHSLHTFSQLGTVALGVRMMVGIPRRAATSQPI